MIVKVPGVSPEDLAEFCAPVFGSPKDEPEDKEERPIRAQRGKAVDLTAPLIRNALRSGQREFTVTMDQVTKFLRRTKDETEIAALERGDVVIVDDPRA